MALEADLLIDRRRLKRRLNFWRVLAVVAVVAFLLVLAPRPGGRFGAAFGERIARYRIEGLIGNGGEQITALHHLRDDPNVAAVVLHLDTPGGAVSGGEGMHQAVVQLAAKKPVVTVMEGVAASAGYMIAVATPHIVARESTLTGSIGVILESGEVSGLLEKVGIHAEQLVSGPLKGQPSFTEPLSAQGREVLQGLVMDLYDQFVGMVVAGRHMDDATVRKLADGRAYTGRQAKTLGLVDEIGGEAEAVAWLHNTRHVAAGLPILDVAKGNRFETLFRSAISDVVIAATDGFAGSIRNALRVDGVYSVWQPSASRE